MPENTRQPLRQPQRGIITSEKARIFVRQLEDVPRAEYDSRFTARSRTRERVQVHSSGFGASLYYLEFPFVLQCVPVALDLFH